MVNARIALQVVKIAQAIPVAIHVRMVTSNKQQMVHVSNAPRAVIIVPSILRLKLNNANNAEQIIL